MKSRHCTLLLGTLSVLLGIAFVACGCKPTLAGSGKLVDRPFDLSGFSRIEASQAFDLDIERAGAFAVSVRIDDNLVDRLRVEQQGDRLRIGLDPAYHYQTGADSLRVSIRLPELRELDLSGACQARLAGFDAAGPLALRLSGASQVRGRLRCARLEARLSGASRIALDGAAESARLQLSGASQAELAGFALQRAEAELSGASQAKLAVRAELTVEASGASELSYLGKPVLGRVETSGASSIKAAGPLPRSGSEKPPAEKPAKASPPAERPPAEGPPSGAATPLEAGQPLAPAVL